MTSESVISFDKVNMEKNAENCLFVDKKKYAIVVSRIFYSSLKKLDLDYEDVECIENFLRDIKNGNFSDLYGKYQFKYHGLADDQCSKRGSIVLKKRFVIVFMVSGDKVLIFNIADAVPLAAMKYSNSIYAAIDLLNKEEKRRIYVDEAARARARKAVMDAMTSVHKEMRKQEIENMKQIIESIADIEDFQRAQRRARRNYTEANSNKDLFTPENS